jgi:hypothetical protein
MKKEAGTLIFKLIFGRHREESREVIGAINCGSIGAAVDDVIALLVANPLLRETADSILEENSKKGHLEGLLRNRDRRIKALEEEVARLKNASESTPKPAKVPKIQEEPELSASAAKECEASKKPKGFIADIHEAARSPRSGCSSAKSQQRCLIQSFC